METVTVRPPLPHAFTKETAAENARKAVAAREAKRLAKRALPSVSIDPYVNKRLARVRAQLEKIDAMMGEELDPQRLDRLASAQARLSAQEFALANRPMPGSFRPSRAPSKRGPESVEPSE
jgi:nuclear transport factor 2 (NTF2) superfamily protein